MCTINFFYLSQLSRKGRARKRATIITNAAGRCILSDKPSGEKETWVSESYDVLAMEAELLGGRGRDVLPFVVVPAFEAGHGRCEADSGFGA